MKTEPVDDTGGKVIGLRVKELRLAVPGLSARHLDRLAGLREGHVSQIEGGKKAHVEAQTVAKLGAVFGAPLWLLTGKGPKPSDRAIRSAVLDAQKAWKAKN